MDEIIQQLQNMFGIIRRLKNPHFGLLELVFLKCEVFGASANTSSQTHPSPVSDSIALSHVYQEL